MLQDVEPCVMGFMIGPSSILRWRFRPGGGGGGGGLPYETNGDARRLA